MQNVNRRGSSDEQHTASIAQCASIPQCASTPQCSPIAQRSSTVTRAAVRCAGWVVPLVLAFGCNSAPKTAVEDQRLIGSWRTAGGDATLSFTATGLYTMNVTELTRPVVGPYQWDQSTGTLTLDTRRESPVCGDDTGVYKVMLSDTTMDAQVERETCSLRQKLLAQPLKRVPPQR